MSVAKAKPFNDQEFEPRFMYGDMASVSEVTGAQSGTELGTGFVRFRNARIPWTVQYDEVLLVIEGSVTIHIEDELIEAKAKDAVWLPKGTKLTYVSESALVFYAIHPANWSESQ